MNKIKTLTFLLAVLLAQVAIAQTIKTSQNKKAIKLFQLGVDELRQQNAEKGITFLNKAIEEDEYFLEAMIVRGDEFAALKRYQDASYDYQQVIDIDEGFYPEAYYKIAKCAFLLQEFEKAEEYISKYLNGPNNNERFTGIAKEIQRNASFAAEAVKKPVDFTPKNLGSGINSRFNEYYPCLTADNNQMLFTRLIPVNSTETVFQEDFFESTFLSNTWTKASGVAGKLNTTYNEGAPTITADGKIMVFAACEEVYGDKNYGAGRKGFGSCDLFYSFKVGGIWSEAYNLGSNINSNLWESQPSISADGRVLYFIRGSRGRKAIITNMDIYVAYLNEDYSWSKAQPLSMVVNSSGDESSVLIHPDGNTLYFASTGHPGFGGEDLYVTRKKSNGQWSTPLNLGYPINTIGDENSLLVSANGEMAYFASDREGGYGGLDLYSFKLHEAVRPLTVSYTKGKVYDAKTKTVLDAEFKLIDIETGEVVMLSNADAATGEFLVSLPMGKEYMLNVQKNGYLFHSENFALKHKNGKTNPFFLDIPLNPILKGEAVVLKNIFFATNDYALKKKSETELNKLIEFLESNPLLSIEIQGHTDDVGAADENQVLSENRAKSVYDYLLSHGIPKERLTYKGYGENIPVADNATEFGRAQNRRTQFVVL